MSRQGPARGAADRWPVFYAPLGLLLALAIALLAAGVVAALASAAGADVDDGTPPGVTLVATLAQQVTFVAVAWLLAARAGSVSSRDLGLIGLPLRRAAIWTIAALGGYYAFTLMYALIVAPQGEQDTLETLGVDRGVGLLIAATVLVIVLAPFAEEIFFRGFLYRVLRNRLGPWSAAALVGIVFGAIHYTGPDTLDLLAPLAVLGVFFCLLYEYTGSLYPAIALHIVNNTIAFAFTADVDAAPLVAGLTGAVALACCAAAATRASAGQRA